jgi:SAM-dependent MidA family methyltransferase
MKEALYHSQFGYYSTLIREVGRGGDFSTSATLDAGLGLALAAWITERARKLKWRRIPVIEIGAGTGALAHSILCHLDWKTRLRTDYMIHETSPVLEKQQRKLLRWKRVRWLSSLPQALKDSHGRAMIFSNELTDAFPCRLFQRKEEGWNELGVKIDPDGSLSEVIIEARSSVPCFRPFDKFPKGQRVERHDSFRDWLHTWSAQWHEGSLLTIDYGDLAEKLYLRRPEGSLRAYSRHQRFTGRDLYARFGQQDLTADVNFSDLIAWGEELGWKSYPLITQREFVASWLSEKQHSVFSQRFTTVGDAGDAFKVLEQIP